MQITSVELENVKSYINAAISFASGTNAICGENGAGKTSIVEAIGFALFDVMPYKREQFVREDAKTAMVTVTFLSSNDDRTYQVVRKTGGSSQYFVYDPEIKSKLVEGKEDVQGWLAEQLGVESASELSGLFTNAVGVAQGTLTAPFLQRASERKPMFDRLLRVEDYDKAWEKLRDTTSHIKDELGDKRESAAAMRAEVKNLPQAQNDADKYQRQADSHQEKLDEITGQLEQVASEKTTYDELERRLDKLNGKIETLTERANGLQDQIRETEKAVTAAREAQRIVEANESLHRQYESAVERLDELEEQRQTRDEIVAKRNELQSRADQSTARLEGLNEQLEEIAQAEAVMENLEPEVQEQERLEAQIQDAQTRQERHKECRAQLAEEKGALKDLEAESKEIGKGLEKRAKLETQRQETQEKLKATEEEIRQLEIQSGQLDTERKRLEQMVELLQQSDVSECPVCRQELTTQHRRQVLGETQEQLRTLKSRASDLKGQIKELRAIQKSQSNLVAEMDSEMSELPRPTDLKSAEKKVERQKAKVTDWEAKVEEYASAAEELKELKPQLKALENPRERYTQAQGVAGGRPKVMREQKKLIEQKEGFEKQIQAMNRDLQPYATLDQDWTATVKLRDAAKVGHNRYTESAPIARTLTQQETRLSKLQSDLGKAQTDLETVSREHAELAKQYDKRAHQRLTKQFEDLTVEKQTIAERLRQAKERLKETNVEVKRLQQVELKLRSIEKEIQELEGIGDLVEYLRKLIRSAGPEVTRMLVQAVSARAARLYGDIMNDPMMRLAWENDYEITVDVAGRSRTFAQLSGGEQMAAALAVRLALLRQVSAIDIAFFDEPTANLDEIRRDNLAEQITNVRGFSQLFVISHDDTFERVTNNLIRVRKVNGASQVQAM